MIRVRHSLFTLAAVGLISAAQTVRAGVVEDVQLLSEYSQEAQQAAYRLFDAGSETLAVAHPLLDDAKQPKKLIVQLITVVGEIGAPASIPHIVNAAKNFPDNAYVNHNAFMVLARLPQTAEALELAETILKTDRQRQAKRSALWYYAAHRDLRGREHADLILANPKAAELHDVALHLLARIGDTGAKEPIAKMLQASQRRGIEYNLMLALAEIVDVDEFHQITQKVNKNSLTYRSALRRVRFNSASDDKLRADIAVEMLESTFVEEKHTATAYLMRSGRTESLSRYMDIGPRGAHPMATLIRGVAVREGIQVITRGDTVEFKRNEEK